MAKDAQVGPGAVTFLFDLGGVLLDWDPRYFYRTVFTDSVDEDSAVAGVCGASAEIGAAPAPFHDEVVIAVGVFRGESAPLLA